MAHDPLRHPSAIKKIKRSHVGKAMREFDRRGRKEMIRSYPGRGSTKWFVYHNRRYYDQKLIFRVAHAKIPGEVALPAGRGTFTAKHARNHHEKLGFKVVARPGKNSSSPPR